MGAAQSAAHHDAEWRRFVHLAMRRDPRIAKVALARKLAVSLYWLWRNAEPEAGDGPARFARGAA